MKILNTIAIISVLWICSLANESLDELKLLHENHAVKKYQTWKAWKNKPISERISVTPKNIIEYVKIDNKLYGFDGIPKKVDINPNFKKDLLDAIKELPNQVTQDLQKYLIGIFIMSGLGSTGFSEHVYKKGNYEGGFIILDQDILSNITANEWASWRVNSAFKKVDDYDLSLKIEGLSTNTRKQAIQFILLHEIAHIIGLSLRAHPKTDDGDPKKFPFSSMSWISFKDSVYDYSFEERKDIKLYSFNKATLNLKDSIKIFSDLSNTDFCSIYASTSFFEDFAEAYTIYVHTMLMKKPYSLKLHYNAKEIQSFENPFMNKNLQKKKEYFDNLFMIKK